MNFTSADVMACAVPDKLHQLCSNRFGALPIIGCTGALQAASACQFMLTLYRLPLTDLVSYS